MTNVMEINELKKPNNHINSLTLCHFTMPELKSLKKALFSFNCVVEKITIRSTNSLIERSFIKFIEKHFLVSTTYNGHAYFLNAEARHETLKLYGITNDITEGE